MRISSGLTADATFLEHLKLLVKKKVSVFGITLH